MKELTVLMLAVLLAVAGEPAPEPKPSLLEQAQAKAEQVRPTLADVDKRERKRCFNTAAYPALTVAAIGVPLGIVTMDHDDDDSGFDWHDTGAFTAISAAGAAGVMLLLGALRC